MIISIVFSTTGLVHLVFSILALITGAMILILRKGTQLHKKIGYLYVISMIGCLVTSFMIYRLFSGWGLFHYMSIVSTISLVGGMVPAFLRKPQENWVVLHFSFMFWSVAGLYGAFISEVFTRMPDANMKLFSVVMFVFFGYCAYFYYGKKAKWAEEFAAIANHK